jgi:hypothetical protein
MIILPRQARNKHRGKLQKDRVSAGVATMSYMAPLKKWVMTVGKMVVGFLRHLKC